MADDVRPSGPVCAENGGGPSGELQDFRPAS